MQLNNNNKDFQEQINKLELNRENQMLNFWRKYQIH